MLEGHLQVAATASSKSSSRPCCMCLLLGSLVVQRPCFILISGSPSIQKRPNCSLEVCHVTCWLLTAHISASCDPSTVWPRCRTPSACRRHIYMWMQRCTSWMPPSNSKGQSLLHSNGSPSSCLLPPTSPTLLCNKVGERLLKRKW